MNSYHSPVTRVACGFAAAAMAALTIGMLVVLPAHLASENGIEAIVAASRQAVGSSDKALPESQPTSARRAALRPS